MKKLNPADLIAARNNQTVNKPYGSTDSNFPLFKTPVNERLLVYIPTLNVVKNPDGTETNVLLPSVTHKFTNGRQFGDINCITGFPMDNPVAEILGYVDENGPHTCPACDALSECWELVNKKTEAMAKQLGMSSYDDKDERLKPYRTQFMGEMAIQRSVEQVTFPIVVVPAKNNKPVEGAIDKMQGYFVTMSKQRYQDKVCAGLAGLFENNGHIAGRWMIWNFQYDSGDKQPIARDAAKNAQFIILDSSAAIEALKPFVAKAEEIGAKFTNEKALEVLTALAPQEYSEIKSVTDRVMKETRNILTAMESGAAAAALPTTTEQALANFGATAEKLATESKTINGNGDLGVTEHRYA